MIRHTTRWLSSIRPGHRTFCSFLELRCVAYALASVSCLLESVPNFSTGADELNSSSNSEHAINLV